MSTSRIKLFIILSVRGIWCQGFCNPRSTCSVGCPRYLATATATATASHSNDGLKKRTELPATVHALCLQEGGRAGWWTNSVIPPLPYPMSDGQIAVLTVGSWTETRTVGFPGRAGGMCPYDGRGSGADADRSRHEACTASRISFVSQAAAQAIRSLGVTYVCHTVTPLHVSTSQQLITQTGLAAAAAAVPHHIRAHGVMPGGCSI